MVLLLARALGGRLVGVVALLAVFFYPRRRTLKLVLIVDAELHATDELAHVYVLVAHAEVVFVEALGDVAPGDSHAGAPHREVALAAHVRHRDAGATEEEQFVAHVIGDRLIAGVLDVFPVDPKRGDTLLVVTGERRREVHRAGAFRSVEPPDRLGDQRGHVDRLRSVAPARRDGEGDADVLSFELRRTRGGFRDASDRRIGDDDLYRLAVGVAQRLFEQFLGGERHVHRLFLEALANPTKAPVDRGAYTDLRKVAA